MRGMLFPEWPLSGAEKNQITRVSQENGFGKIEFANDFSYFCQSNLKTI